MKKHSAGLTLVEVLVALAVLTIAIVAIVPAFLSNLALNSRQEIKTQAAAAAQVVLDRWRLVEPVDGSMPAGGSAPAENVSVGGRSFSVTPQFCTVPAYCTSSSRQIRVNVAYQGQAVFSAETVYAQVNYVPAK